MNDAVTIDQFMKKRPFLRSRSISNMVVINHKLL